MSVQAPARVALSARRMFAMVLRHWYLLSRRGRACST